MTRSSKDRHTNTPFPANVHSIRYRAYALLVVALILTSMTIERNALWRDDLRLWRSELLKAPDNWRAHYWLGSYYRKTGAYRESIRHLLIVKELQPAYTAVYWDLANVYGIIGDAEKELATYYEALGVVRDLRDANPGIYGYFEEQLLGRIQAVRLRQTQ